MSEEGLDLDLQRASATWPRPVRIALAAPDPSWPTAVEVALLRPDDARADDRRRLRDLLRADPAAARRYTDVRRGLAGDYRDLAAYRAAKGPVIAALLR